MALNTDTARLMSGAAQMETIGNDVLGALGRYVAMNQNLTGAGFIGALQDRHEQGVGPDRAGTGMVDR